MTRTASLLTSIAAVLALGGPAAAKPPKGAAAAPTACNFKALPLSPGNTWTYKSGASMVTLKVLEVGPGKDYAGKPATLATLEEQYNGRTLKTVFACTPANGLQAPLESFFFTGEPGGGVGTDFVVTARERATLLPDDQIITDQGWIESVKADATRTDMGGAGAVHPPAKVEVERHVTVKAPEKMMIGLGQFSPVKITFELRGRAILGEEKTEIPIKRPASMWLAKGIGFVKIEDAFDKTWELVDTNLVAK